MDYDSMSDEELTALYNKKVNKPDYDNMSDEELFSLYSAAQQPKEGPSLTDKIMSSPLVQGNLGAGEAALSLVSGIPEFISSTAAKAGAGLAGLVQGDNADAIKAGMDQAAREHLLADTTYQPRTEAGKKIMGGIMPIMEAIPETAGNITRDIVGSFAKPAMQAPVIGPNGEVSYDQKTWEESELAKASKLLGSFGTEAGMAVAPVKGVAKAPARFIDRFSKGTEIDPALKAATDEYIAGKGVEKPLPDQPATQMELPLAERNIPEVYKMDQAPDALRQAAEQEAYAKAMAEKEGILSDTQAQSPQYELFGPKETPTYVKTLEYDGPGLAEPVIDRTIPNRPVDMSSPNKTRSTGMAEDVPTIDFPLRQEALINDPVFQKLQRDYISEQNTLNQLKQNRASQEVLDSRIAQVEQARKAFEDYLAQYNIRSNADAFNRNLYEYGKRNELPPELRGPQELYSISPLAFAESFKHTIKLAEKGIEIAYRFAKDVGVKGAIIVDIKDSTTGKRVGGALFEPKNPYDPLPETNLRASAVALDKEYRGKGIAQDMYQGLARLGNDVEKSAMLSPDGKAMWDKFEKRGVSKNGVISKPDILGAFRKKQGGSWVPFESSGKSTIHTSDLGTFDEFKAALIAKGIPSNADFAAAWKYAGGGRIDPVVRDPKVTAAKNSIPLSDKQKRALTELGDKTLPFEDVKAQIKAEPDYTDTAMSNVRGLVGLNELAAATKSTGVRWAINQMLSSVRKWENITKDMLYNRHEGIFPVIQKMAKFDKQQFMDLWAAERLVGNKEFAGKLSKEAQALWDHRTKINDWVWENTKRIISEVFPERIPDLERIKKRINYFNDNIHGAWTVTVKNADGQVVKITGEKTKARAQEAYKWLVDNTKDIEGVKVESVQYRPELQELLNSKGMDKFDKTLAFEDLMSLGLDTPEGSAIMQRKAAYEQSLAWDFAKHKERMMHKGNVSIAPGNKPWRSAMDNAAEGWNHWLRYVENFSEWAGYQEGMLEIKKLLGDAELADKPGLKKRIKQIAAQIHHEQNTLLGKAQDTAIKAAAKYTGQDPATIRAGVSEGRTAGILWYLSTVKNFIVQELQAGVTYAPWMQLLKDKYDLQGSTVLSAATGAAVQAYIHMPGAGLWRGVDLNMSAVKRVLGSDIAEILSYAKENGVISSHILDTRELKVNPGSVSKTYDTVRDVASKVLVTGDIASRAGFFVGAVKFLEQAGLPRADALPLAAHLDRLAMVDYNSYNIPNVYKKLGGEMGMQSAALSRFKHNQYWQYYFLSKNSPKAFTQQIAAQFAVAGLLGMPLMQEIDSLWRQLQKWGAIDAKAHTPSGILIRSKNIPTWASFGPLSYFTKYDFSTPLGNPNPIPDDPMKALFPMAGFYGNMAGGIWDVAKGAATSNLTKVQQGALALTPPQFKVIPEERFFGNRTAGGLEHKVDMYDPKNPEQYMYSRDLGDTISRVTGGRSLDESLIMRQRSENKMEDLLILDRKKSLTEKYMELRRHVSGPSAASLSKIRQEYRDLGGNPNYLEQSYVKGKIVMAPEKKALIGKTTVDKMRRYQRLKDETGED